jgi:hypothetical protein
LATLLETGTPSTVKHHFLIHAVPKICGTATAETENLPVTDELFAIDHSAIGA